MESLPFSGRGLGEATQRENCKLKTTGVPLIAARFLRPAHIVAIYPSVQESDVGISTIL
jgi:hypothetical protein